MKGTHVSTSEDMVHGSSGSDKVEAALERMEDSFDDPSMYHEGSAASEIAKVLQLDKELGLAQDGDKVVLHPALAAWLPGTVTIVSPQELAEIDARMRADEERELTEAKEKTLERLGYEWLQIRFDLSDPETKEPYPYHPILKDRTLSVRVLTEKEYDDVEFMCASVRADGTLISIGKPPRVKF